MIKKYMNDLVQKTKKSGMVTEKMPQSDEASSSTNYNILAGQLDSLIFGNTASEIYIAGMCLQNILFLKIVSHVSCMFVNKKGTQNHNISDLLRCCTATPQCKPKISHIRTLLWTSEAQS